jgi:hypothetical protein
MATEYSALKTELISAANGVSYVYRDTGRTGAADGVPLVLLQHLRGNLDNWDPALVRKLVLASSAPLRSGNRAVVGSGLARPTAIPAGGRAGLREALSGS